MADSVQSQPPSLANLRKLTAVALNLFRTQGWIGGADAEFVMKGLGKSPIDFAADAMTEFYAQADRYTIQSEDDAFALMVTILQHRFIDACRKHAHSKTADVQEDQLPEREGPNSSDSLRAEEMEALAYKFRKYADGKKDLIELVDAVAILVVEQRNFQTRTISQSFLE